MPIATMLLLGLLLMGSVDVYAQEFYRYQDERGRWHYSDEKPNSNAEKVVLQAAPMQGNQVPDASAQIVLPSDLCPADLARRPTHYRSLGGHLGKKGRFELIKEDQGDVRRLYAVNDYFAPVTLRLAFTQ